MTNELLACHLCGGKCVVQPLNDDGILYVCEHDPMFGGECFDGTAYSSTQAWNTRPIATPSDDGPKAAETLVAGEAIERLRDALARQEAASLGFTCLVRKDDLRTLLAMSSKADDVVAAVEPILRFHETGGHEGDGSDAALARARACLDSLIKESGDGR